MQKRRKLARNKLLMCPWTSTFQHRRVWRTPGSNGYTACLLIRQRKRIGFVALLRRWSPSDILLWRCCQKRRDVTSMTAAPFWITWKTPWRLTSQLRHYRRIHRRKSSMKPTNEVAKRVLKQEHPYLFSKEGHGSWKVATWSKELRLPQRYRKAAAVNNETIWILLWI